MQRKGTRKQYHWEHIRPCRSLILTYQWGRYRSPQAPDHPGKPSATHFPACVLSILLAVFKLCKSKHSNTFSTQSYIQEVHISVLVLKLFGRTGTRARCIPHPPILSEVRKNSVRNCSLCCAWDTCWLEECGCGCGCAPSYGRWEIRSIFAGSQSLGWWMQIFASGGFQRGPEKLSESKLVVWVGMPGAKSCPSPEHGWTQGYL